MNTLFISSGFLLSALLVFTQGVPSHQKYTQHEIIAGNCSNATYKDRVYYDHVDKSGWPLIVRSETVKYNGSGVIYCIQALNQKNNETGGIAEITVGGVGYKNVTIELQSFRGHGLEFYVSIYAKNSSRNSSSTHKYIPPQVFQELAMKIE